jgi:hypothetical protein
MASARYAHDQAAVPQASKVPPFFWDQWIPAEFEDWMSLYRPDGLVSQGSLPLDLINAKPVTERIKTCWLVAQRNKPEFTGPLAQQEEVGAQAVNSLSYALVRGIIGPPAVPNELLVPPQWRVGTAG